jgi:hypothetical protein
MFYVFFTLAILIFKGMFDKNAMAFNRRLLINFNVQCYIPKNTVGLL